MKIKDHNPVKNNGNAGCDFGREETFTLNISESCAMQMMEMAIQLYKEKPDDPKEIASWVIEGTKEMIRRGKITNGIIVSDGEKVAEDDDGK